MIYGKSLNSPRGLYVFDAFWMGVSQWDGVFKWEAYKIFDTCQMKTHCQGSFSPYYCKSHHHNPVPKNGVVVYSMGFIPTKNKLYQTAVFCRHNFGVVKFSQNVF